MQKMTIKHTNSILSHHVLENMDFLAPIYVWNQDNGVSTLIFTAEVDLEIFRDKYNELRFDYSKN